jgi:hypothetical protein
MPPEARLDPKPPVSISQSATFEILVKLSHSRCSAAESLDKYTRFALRKPSVLIGFVRGIREFGVHWLPFDQPLSTT